MASPISNPEPNFVLVAPDPATDKVERLRRQALRLLTETCDDDAPEPPPVQGRDTARRDSEPAPGSAPSMIIGVLAMPAVFLAIVFVALSLFGKPGDEAQSLAAAPEALAQPARAAAVSSAPDPRSVIALADDVRIQSIALDGDRVALHVEGPSGREIVIYDYREGRQIAAAAIETFSTEAADTLSMLTGPPPSAAPAMPAPVAESAPPAPRVEARLKPRSTR